VITIQIPAKAVHTRPHTHTHTHTNTLHTQQMDMQKMHRYTKYLSTSVLIGPSIQKHCIELRSLTMMRATPLIVVT